jgi:phosphoglycerate-specific signal transduction histidine kinase
MKGTVSSKLVELRIKTDRELLALAKSELRRAQIMASVAATKRSPLHQRANQIVQRTARLLSTISGVDEGEREALEATLKDVRLTLDRIPEQVRCESLSIAGR